MPRWAKKTKLYNEKNGRFMWGLIFRVIRILQAYKKVDNSFTIEYPAIIFDHKIDNFYDKELRDYQKEAIETFLHYKIGIIQLPCGSGKTRIAKEIIKQLNTRTLVIVHTKELLKQWGNDDLYDIYTYQKFVRMVENDEIQKNYYNLIIADECHLCKCKSIKNIFKNINFKYALGLSASPKREDLHDMQIEECVGQVIYQKETKDLIDSGYLCNASVVVSNIAYSNEIFETYQELYDDNIVKNQERNLTIIEICKDNKDKYILVLVDRLEHGYQFYNCLKVDGYNVVYFNSKMKERNKIFEEIKQKKYNIIISTQIFDTGIDFPWLDSLVLACGGKSAVKIIQRTGRGLRKYEGKNIFTIFDFNDKAKILHRHFNKRLKYYKECGFNVE